MQSKTSFVILSWSSHEVILASHADKNSSDSWPGTIPEEGETKKE